MHYVENLFYENFSQEQLFVLMIRIPNNHFKKSTKLIFEKNLFSNIKPQAVRVSTGNMTNPKPVTQIDKNLMSEHY